MEAYHTGVEDYLIDSLSFKLPPGSSYVIDRKKSSYWAVGSNIYQPTTGTKVMKFVLSGEEGTWLDPGTVRLNFTVNNTDPTANHLLRPLGGAHLFIRRVRILCGNTLVEDIMNYGRNHQMLQELYNNSGAKSNLAVENFGYDNITLSEFQKTTTSNTRGISPGTGQPVSFTLLSGLLGVSNKKFLPMKYAPITIEVEIVNNATEPLISETDDPGVTGTITADNTSTSWSLTDCQIKCDTVLLDSGLNNSYTKHLLEGKALPLEFETFISQESSVQGGKFSVQVSRAVSRLNRMFLTFFNTGAAGLSKNENKQGVSFYHPMASGGNFTSHTVQYDPTKELEFQIQLGGKLYPEYPCRSIAECFTILKETLNLPDKYQHSTSISYDQYTRNKFIFAMDFEKVRDADWTGTNTKAGQVLIVKVNGNSGITGDIATSMFSTLVNQQVLEIRDVGCTLFD